MGGGIEGGESLAGDGDCTLVSDAAVCDGGCSVALRLPADMFNDI